MKYLRNRVTEVSAQDDEIDDDSDPPCKRKQKEDTSVEKKSNGSLDIQIFTKLQDKQGRYKNVFADDR